MKLKYKNHLYIQISTKPSNVQNLIKIRDIYYNKNHLLNMMVMEPAQI